MATVGNGGLPTLSDVAKRLDPDGKIDAVVEMLSEDNPILQDMVVMASNEPLSHRSTIRTGLPTPTWRYLNYGVPATKSRTAQIRDSLGSLEDYGEVDKDEADLNGNTAEWRMSEDSAHIEAMSQEMADTTVYGNTANAFLGLAPRFNDLAAENGGQVRDAGGTGSDNRSVWAINWGPMHVFGIYPKGTKAGLTVTDKGQVTLYDENNDKFEGYRTHYAWKLGLVVKDWRYLSRVANIDSSALTADASAGAKLLDEMVYLVQNLKSTSRGRTIIYAPKRISTYLWLQASNKTNVNLTVDNAGGNPIVRFQGIEIKQLDALNVDEARVT